MAGCLNRQASDFKDYQPKIWLVDTEQGTAEPINVSDEVEIVENSAIKEQDERRGRISAAFIEILKGAKKLSFDYKANVDAAMEKDTTLSEGAKNIIQEFVNE
jgi:hypothetical protein